MGCLLRWVDNTEPNYIVKLGLQYNLAVLLYVHESYTGRVLQMKTVVMTKRQAVKMFGNQAKLADALGISRQAVGQWPDNSPIPSRHALRIYYELKSKECQQ